MAGRHQIAPILRNPPIGWQMQFAQLGRSEKLTCLICGRTGYNWYAQCTPPRMIPSPWQADCLLGHPEQCPDCEAKFVKGGLYRHLFCRAGHPRCPLHLSTQHRRLMEKMTA